MGRPAKNEFDPKAFLARVGAGKTISKIKKNQHVFKQGGVADTVFYIQEGRVKLTVLSEQGKEAVVGILEAGQFFGEGCLNGHSLRIATTTAMEECVITSITKEAMIAALRSEPKFSELFMAYLLTRNSRVEEDLIDQLDVAWPLPYEASDLRDVERRVLECLGAALVGEWNDLPTDVQRRLFEHAASGKSHDAAS